MGTSGKIKEEGEGGPEKKKKGEGRGAERQRGTVRTEGARDKVSAGEERRIDPESQRQSWEVTHMEAGGLDLGRGRFQCCFGDSE